jgi:hypothetical protein
MTITEHTAHRNHFDDSEPATSSEPHRDPVDAAPVGQILAPAPVLAVGADPQSLQRPSLLRRLSSNAQGRRYHHPRRERFVEEAAMSREMFRL